jgi:ABC-type uncharacterized transport system permease subunit
VPDILLHVTASALYAALALYFWRTRWAATAPGAMRPWERAMMLVPLALHGWLLYRALVLPATLHFGFGLVLSVTMWFGVLVYIVESLFLNLDGMQPLVLPIAALTAPLPSLFPGLAGVSAYAASLEFRLHVLLAMAAYSVFTIAILHAVLMSLIERRLHRVHRGTQPDDRRAHAGDGSSQPLIGPWASLPPLLTLERLLFRLIGIAFALLTLTLATGSIFSESLFGRPVRFNHKTVFAVLSWLTFAALLFGRHFYGWRGRTALRWTLAGFVFLLLAYVGSRFVLEVVLGRT